MFKILKSLICVLMVSTVQAQMAHEVLLLVNKNSQASLLVGNTFLDARNIPKQNLVYLDIPESAYGGNATITPEQFTQMIWEPANAVAKERGIDSQILAWVYSVDFPIRVKTDTNDRRQMSVGGLTFVRNEIPDLSWVEDGKYLSKLFGGPNERLKLSLTAFSLGIHKNGMGMNAQVPPEVAYLQGGLGKRMPLPSMMLGYIGEKGTEVETVLQTIARGRQSDHNGRRNGIYFVTTDDVRSTCREWQYDQVTVELKQRGVEATTTTNFPAGAENVMGLLMGAETVDPSLIKSFAPGAMAEHLTSWSAEFQKPQSKTTDWIKAGATGSAGAVVEPYSNANKFPSARFFAHYASGCTMLESFYQSMACPLQSLIIGDPLAKPYAPRISVELLGADTLNKEFTYFAKTTCFVKKAQYLYSFFLDGKEIKEVSPDPSVQIYIHHLSDGYHQLRAVVRIQHRVQFSASVDKAFTVNCKGRSVSVHPDIQKLETHKYSIKTKIGGEELPEKLRLLCGEWVLDEKVYTPEVELILDELQIGEGPNEIRTVAIYADGMEVSSTPVGFGILFSKEP